MVLRQSLAYALRRLAQAVPTVLVIVALNFLLLQLAPGDAADVLAGEAGSATPEFMAQLRKTLRAGPAAGRAAAAVPQAASSPSTWASRSATTCRWSS